MLFLVVIWLSCPIVIKQAKVALEKLSGFVWVN